MSKAALSSECPSYGCRSFTDEEYRSIQSSLDLLLAPEHVKTRMAFGNMRVRYIEGWKAIQIANELFGFNGWTSEIMQLNTDFIDMKDEAYSIGVSCTVRITLKDGTYREDIGFGSCENVKSKAMGLEKSKKEAVTDAIKRALRTFGNCLGNCLYDKYFIDNLKNLKAVKRKPITFDQLYHSHGRVYPDLKKEEATTSETNGILLKAEMPSQKLPLVDPSTQALNTNSNAVASSSTASVNLGSKFAASEDGTFSGDDSDLNAIYHHCLDKVEIAEFGGGVTYSYGIVDKYAETSRKPASMDNARLNNTPSRTTSKKNAKISGNHVSGKQTPRKVRRVT